MKLLRPSRSLNRGTVQRGTLITFRYQFRKNDPTPLVLITDTLSGLRIRGVNLHYVTLNAMLKLLAAYGNAPTFSYRNIMGDKHLTNAFRHYHWQGVVTPLVLDVDFIKQVIQVMQTQRLMQPNELDAIVKMVEEQINIQANPKANELVQGIPGMENA